MEKLKGETFDLKRSDLKITCGTTLVILILTWALVAAGIGFAEPNNCGIAGTWDIVSSGGLGSIRVLFDSNGSGTGNTSISGNPVQYNFQGHYTLNNSLEGNWIAGYLQGTFTFIFVDGNNCNSATGQILSIVNTLPFNATRVLLPNSTGSITRSISNTTISPENILIVTLTPSPDDIFSSAGFNVTEIIPPGFTYLNATAIVSISDNVLTFTQSGNATINYTLRAPSVNGSYSINGTFIDRLSNTGIVGGTTSIRIGTGYDANGDGRIDKNEAIQAVIDYFRGNISRQEVIDVIILYFSQG